MWVNKAGILPQQGMSNYHSLKPPKFGSSRHFGEVGPPYTPANGRFYRLKCGHSTASPADTSVLPPVHLHSLTVVPLIGDQRYYGETTV